MVRVRNKSEIITLAQRRLSGMKSIDDKLNLGNGCSTATVEAQLNETRKKLEAYNKLLSQATAAGNEFEQAEKELAKLTKKILLGVAMKYDHESNEYEMVGGVRPSERKRTKPQMPAMA